MLVVVVQSVVQTCVHHEVEHRGLHVSDIALKYGEILSLSQRFNHVGLYPLAVCSHRPLRGIDLEKVDTTKQQQLGAARPALHNTVVIKTAARCR